MGHLQVLDILVIIIYMAGMLFLGFWFSRRQSSLEEYFLAGRGMSSWVAGLSTTASLISTVSYLSLPGEVIKNGPGWLWVLFHVPVSFLVIGYLVIPHIMAQPITTGYELLEKKLGNPIRKAASLMFVLSRIFWMGLVIYTCSFAVVTVSGLPLPYVLISVGAIGTGYTVLGGIRAVMITDVIQFLILFGGAVLTIVVVTFSCGGISGWWPDWTSPQIQTLHWQKIEIFSLNPFNRLTAISMLLYAMAYWVCTSTADQVVIQRFLCTRNAREARRSFAVTLLGDMTIVFTMSMTGIALLGFFLHFPDSAPLPDQAITEQADQLFPHFIGSILPAGITGLVVAALFAAAMSSLDSGINSIGTVLLNDFPETFGKGCHDDVTHLHRAKLISLGVGIVAILLSATVSWFPGENLLEIAVRIGSLFVPSLFVVFILAFFVPFSTPAGAWVAIGTAFLSSLIMTYWQTIIRWVYGVESDFSIVLIMPLASLFGLICGTIVCWFTRSSQLYEGSS